MAQDRLRIKRGDSTKLPNLLPGEPVYSLDAQKMHIGNATGGNTNFMNNEQINANLGAAQQAVISKAQETQTQINELIKCDDAETNLNLRQTTSSSAINALELNHKIFNLASSSQHVTMQNGLNLEQAYTGALDSASQTFKTNGTDITVDNGMEYSKVLSAKIAGQTVKNLYGDITTSNCVSSGGAKIKDGYFEVTHTAGVEDWCSLKDLSQIQPATKYDYIVEIFDLIGTPVVSDTLNISNNTVVAVNNTSSIKLPIANGFTKITLKTKAEISELVRFSQMVVPSTATNRISFKFRVHVLPAGMGEFVNSYIPFGLSSTQAILSNNNTKYAFYKSLDDKASGKIITLRKVEDKVDTLELLEDGSGTLTQNTYEAIFDGSDDENCHIHSVGPGGVTNFELSGLPYKAKNNSFCLCNKYLHDWKTISEATREGILITNTFFYIRRFVSSGITTVALFKAELKENPVVVHYKLESPIITHIPKELVSVILTQLSNTFSVKSDVLPSELSIAVPINQNTQIDTLLTKLESNAAVVATLATEVK